MNARKEGERSSIIVHTLAAQSRSGLCRTGQGWSAVGLGCAMIMLYPEKMADLSPESGESREWSGVE